MGPRPSGAFWTAFVMARTPGSTTLALQESRAGRASIDEGDPAHEVYAIVEGECRAFRQEDGTPLTLMGPGEVFGEVAFFTASTRTASVKAVTDATVMVLGREDLSEQLEVGSWLSVMVATLARRFAEKDRRVAELEAELRALSG